MHILDCLSTMNYITKYIELRSVDQIIDEVSKLYQIKTIELCNMTMGDYLKGMGSISYYLVIKDLKENIYKYEWLYHRLEDKKSKELLINLLRYSLTTNIDFIENAFDKESMQYFCKDIVRYEDMNAILGAKNSIKENSPKLAIYLHDMVSDLWKIPLFIDSINDNYNFYLRYYEENGACETVLYAVPRNENKNIENDKKGFYLIPIMQKYINNARLIKDIALIPYLMHKYRGYQSVVVSEKDEYRLYLNKYVDGLKIEILNQNLDFNDSIMNYIAKNYKIMDNIMLFGLHSDYFDIVKFFKKIKSDGNIYLKLDANSSLMDSIDFNSKQVIEFLQNIDVISVESKVMKKYLSKKIGYKKIEYIPNGYLNDRNDSYINYEEKENVIITVGRLGTAQKNNEILLEAFKLVADEISNWKLKLVGNIEEEFYDYIENYFEENPNLRSRVIFMGDINDKDELFNEYKKSKIFTLTSTIEDGSPSAYSEAAFYGNYVITSDIDAALDMTNNLNNGDIFDVGNTLELASILLKRCKNEAYIESKCIEVQEYIRGYYDYERMVSKIDYLLKL